MDVDYHRPGNVQGFAVDVSFFGRQFLSEIQMGPQSLGILGLDHVAIDQVFQESVRQVFDILSPDFQDFTEQLMFLPDWKYFMHADKILSSSNTQTALQESIKRLGLGIWLLLYTAGFFLQPRIFVLQNVNQNLLYFWTHED